MKVVLVQDVPNVGRSGDVKDVADGYARNYLIPRGLAKLATAAALAEVKQRQEAEARREARREEEFRELAAKIREIELVFRVRVGEQGRLYGSITAGDVAEQLEQRVGHEIDKRRVELEDPIRQLGRFQVPIRLSQRQTAKVTVVVEPEA